MPARARRPAAALAVVALLAGAAAAQSPGPADDPYSQLIYDYEVALICGLANEVLHGAYTAARERLEAGSELDADRLTERRVTAMAAADLEHQNRGLGGFRPWCELDGKAGVARIMEAAEK
jgi:hypothetical protein